MHKISQLVQDTLEFSRRQAGYALLANVIAHLNDTERDGLYMLDDEGLLWQSTITSPSRVAVPRSMILGVMALVHTKYAHLGVGWITALIQRRYHRLTYKRDVKDYVPSCG